MGVKNMKKFIITTCGAIVIGLLMISSATAVPKVNSDPLMDIVNEIEQNQKIIEENIATKTLDLKTSESINLLIKKIKDTIYGTSSTLGLGDLIDLIIKIIQWLVTFLQKLISFFSLIFNLVELIYTLITIIVNIYNLIMAIIEFINNIINPEPLKTT
jgi:phage-related minor tail protein